MKVRYEIRHLRHFIAVAEELNFSVAAARSNLAQPALSRSIKQLENLVGVRLLERSSHKVRITEAGETFLYYAYKVMEQLKELEYRTTMRIHGESGRLRVGYTNFAILGCLPGILSRFKKHHKEITIDLIYNFTYQQIEDVTNDKIDFGFITGPNDNSNLQGFTAQKDKIVAIVSRQHSLATRSTIKLEELADESFIVGDTSRWRHFNSHIKAVCLQKGFFPKIVQEAYDSDGILGLIAANMGVTLHVDSVRNNQRRGTTILRLADVDELILTDMIWNQETITPIKSKFIKFVRQYVNAGRS